MAVVGDDGLLVKIAVWGIAISMIATVMISVLVVSDGSDYSNDEINAYRDDLIRFSGESMLNQSPWVLSHVYTPWDPSTSAADHVDPDGWLYGSEITDYAIGGESQLKKSADIRLDPGQKSSVPLTYTSDAAEFTVKSGTKWWYYQGIFGSTALISDIVAQFKDPYEYATISADNWNYTGYRYVFDPTLPFTAANTDESGDVKTSTRDGALSLVWYNYGGQEGLSGGLDVYGGNVLLASYSASDIIAGYQSASGYATTYDFDFQGTILTLSIRFDQNVIESGTTLMQAWTAGDWSMAISSASAGNFFDIDDSNAFSVTAGGMISTFIQIFTFSLPSISNAWMDLILWLIVGLPMTIAMLCITLRLVNGFRVI